MTTDSHPLVNPYDYYAPFPDLFGMGPEFMIATLALDISTEEEAAGATIGILDSMGLEQSLKRLGTARNRLEAISGANPTDRGERRRIDAAFQWVDQYILNIQNYLSREEEIRVAAGPRPQA